MPGMGALRKVRAEYRSSHLLASPTAGFSGRWLCALPRPSPVAQRQIRAGLLPSTDGVAGVPARVLREFSQRSTQIAEWLQAAGRSGPVATDEAILATRASKQTPADWAVVEADWRTRADAMGWGPTELEQLLATTGPAVAHDGFVVDDVVWSDGESTVVARVVEFKEWLEWLLETRVTANDATFTRFNLT
jgi:hypothetical protein